jgi:hypothetical protein
VSTRSANIKDNSVCKQQRRRSSSGVRVQLGRDHEIGWRCDWEHLGREQIHWRLEGYGVQISEHGIDQMICEGEPKCLPTRE